MHHIWDIIKEKELNNGKKLIKPLAIPTRMIVLYGARAIMAKLVTIVKILLIKI